MQFEFRYRRNTYRMKEGSFVIYGRETWKIKTEYEVKLVKLKIMARCERKKESRKRQSAENCWYWNQSAR